ncbi:hypothetical protein [Clostridium botulinum]|uniref:hypothetical protein n=1 Tax=Clostridium botulinum TaxID=1491 RepID=UPI0013FF952E|nr:hypothetical protein [Clostridium botulinum]MBY6910162.1 hypothetical protein [Clostridium botulinum]MBY6921951.1 hypothetical protein [Clostridium botulinum]NFM72137.1 hypothetical protein [Clostridium botulinum]
MKLDRKIQCNSQELTNNSVARGCGFASCSHGCFSGCGINCTGKCTGCQSCETSCEHTSSR